MKAYFEPELKISIFSSEDIVTDSSDLNNIQGTETGHIESTSYEAQNWND